MKNRLLSLCVAGITSAIFVSLGGCAAKTRLGYLIPSHVKSQNIDGEIANAYFFPNKPISETTCQSEETEQTNEDGTNRKTMALPIVGAAAGILANVLLDAAKQEITREADSYEHQYQSPLLLTTEDLKNGGYIMVVRWTDDGSEIKVSDKNQKNENSPSKDIVSTEDPISLPDDYSQVVDLGTEGPSTDNVNKFLNTHKPPGKTYSSVFIMKVDTPKQGSTVYKLSAANIFVDSIGAKVVDFGFRNAWKFWQWLGALVFATDSQATIGTNMSVKALVSSKSKQGDAEFTSFRWESISPEGDGLSNVNVGLDDLPKTKSLSGNVGSWLAVPNPINLCSKENPIQIGYLLFNFSFTEKDTSNAKKYLKQSVDGIEKNRGQIPDLIKTAFGEK